MTKAEIEAKYKALKKTNEDLKNEIKEYIKINEELEGKITILENSKVDEEEIEKLKKEVEKYKPASAKIKQCIIERK